MSQPAKGAARAPRPINGMAMWTLRGRPGHDAGGGPTRPARGRASITLGQGGGASTGAGQWCGDTGALRRRGRPGRSARGAPLSASISAGGGRHDRPGSCPIVVVGQGAGASSAAGQWQARWREISTASQGAIRGRRDLTQAEADAAGGGAGGGPLVEPRTPPSIFSISPS